MSTEAVPVGDRTYRSVNPATGELMREFARADEHEANIMLDRAHYAYQMWRGVVIERRVELFRAIAGLIEEEAENLAHQVTVEMGKPLSQSRAEPRTIAAIFRYYADHGPELLADEDIAVPGLSRTRVRREPVGVVLGVEPWNVPLYQAMRVAAPNLMLGNTVLLKPAENTAGSTLLLDELFRRAGFPENVYRTALLAPEQVSALIADPRVRGVTLTGSNRAGRIVGEQASRHNKPVVLELGGSDAYVVLDSADVPRAARTAVAGRLRNAGQVCFSPKRIIVTDQIADEFIDRFTGEFADQVVGDPLDPHTTVGPLSSAGAAESLQMLYQDALDKGATVLVAGGSLDGPGAFFQPAAIAGITREMLVYEAEVFGPLAMIYRVSDITAAVGLANDTAYGLGGTVFAEDLDEAHWVAHRLDAGMVGINNHLGAPIEIPFGGTKSSGVGRELGRTGMDTFANIKTYGLA